MKPKNPFVTLGYQGPEYFCDRQTETKKLLSAVGNDRNVTLIAPRRYGKTGLIHHAFNALPSEFTGVYLDIYALGSLAEFACALASAVVGAADTPLEKTLSVVARFFKSCRPTITPQEDGLPKFSFDVAPEQAEATLRETFDYLRRKKRRLVIAIDEFQQILEFPEKGTEALLRTCVQDVPWVRFVFAGSRRHLMGEMFLSAKHPFYNSTDILSLDVIDRTKYAEFAGRFFAAARRRFSRDAFDALYDRVDGVTWYVQKVLNRLWEAGEGFTDMSQADAAIRNLAADRALVFSDLLGSQNDVARRLLSAIAREGAVAAPTSSAFLRRYAFSASSVRSSIGDLLRRELLYKDERGYLVYDRLLSFWLRNRSVV